MSSAHYHHRSAAVNVSTLFTYERRKGSSEKSLHFAFSFEFRNSLAGCCTLVFFSQNLLMLLNSADYTFVSTTFETAKLFCQNKTHNWYYILYERCCLREMPIVILSKWTKITEKYFNNVLGLNTLFGLSNPVLQMYA